MPFDGMTQNVTKYLTINPDTFAPVASQFFYYPTADALPPMPRLYASPPPHADAVRAVLQRAKAEVTDPNRWIKGAAFVWHPSDPSIDEYSPMVIGMCAAAAMVRAAGPANRSYAEAAIRVFEEANGLPYGHVPPWNDHIDRTHAEVIAAFDRAIAAVH